LEPEQNFLRIEAEAGLEPTFSDAWSWSQSWSLKFEFRLHSFCWNCTSVKIIVFIYFSPDKILATGIGKDWAWSEFGSAE